MVFFFQVFQLQNLRLVIGAVHVMDLKFPEITYHNPTGIPVVRQIARITARLLIRCQQAAV